MADRPFQNSGDIVLFKLSGTKGHNLQLKSEINTKGDHFSNIASDWKKIKDGLNNYVL